MANRESKRNQTAPDTNRGCAMSARAAARRTARGVVQALLEHELAFQTRGDKYVFVRLPNRRRLANYQLERAMFAGGCGRSGEFGSRAIGFRD